MKHTPTPWKIGDYQEVLDPADQKVRVNGFSLTLGRVDHESEPYENSRFIVRAVNAHDELVEEVTLLLETWIEEDRQDGIKTEGPHITRLKKLLHKATGEWPVFDDTGALNEEEIRDLESNEEVPA